MYRIENVSLWKNYTQKRANLTEEKIHQPQKVATYDENMSSYYLLQQDINEVLNI